MIVIMIQLRKLIQDGKFKNTCNHLISQKQCRHQTDKLVYIERQ